MGSAFSENDNNYRLELVHDANRVLNDVDDVFNMLKTKKRDIEDKITYLESQMTTQSEIEAAILIRKAQYLEALLSKNKYELEKIFFPNGRGNCIIPDVFQWYQEPN